MLEGQTKSIMVFLILANLHFCDVPPRKGNIPLYKQACYEPECTVNKHNTIIIIIIITTTIIIIINNITDPLQ